MSGSAAIAEFCNSVGLPPAEPPIAFEFERSGRLHIERAGDWVTVSLVRPMPLHRTGAAAAALAVVHPDRGLPLPVRAAFLGEDELVLLTRIPEDQLDLPMLNTAIGLLSGLANQVEAAAR
jgi:type III secretion system chaperone SycN